LGHEEITSQYEVTQGQWQQIMGEGENPSQFKSDDRPVERVSWEDVQAFIRRLNAREGGPRAMYWLPTEAEWEYAARAETKTAYSFGDDPGELDRYGWYGRNADLQTHLVWQAP
jgi:formylglycine-generating enzyme required for sulfatase activity